MFNAETEADLKRALRAETLPGAWQAVTKTTLKLQASTSGLHLQDIPRRLAQA